jgi:hypothetical protein
MKAGGLLQSLKCTSTLIKMTQAAKNNFIYVSKMFSVFSGMHIE